MLFRDVRRLRFSVKLLLAYMKAIGSLKELNFTEAMSGSIKAEFPHPLSNISGFRSRLSEGFGRHHQA